MTAGKTHLSENNLFFSTSAGRYLRTELRCNSLVLMAAPPACHHEEYQLIGAGHVDCCLFVFYINSDRNIENVKTRFSLRKKKKRLQMKHKPTVLSLVLRVVTGDFTWLYKSYSYIQGGPRDSNQQSHGSPDTDMKPTSEPMKEQNLKYCLNRK